MNSATFGKEVIHLGQGPRTNFWEFVLRNTLNPESRIQKVPRDVHGSILCHHADTDNGGHSRVLTVCQGLDTALYVQNLTLS